MEIKRGRFKIKYRSKDNDIYGEIDDELKNIQTITKTKVYAPRNPVTVHPIGGACLGTSNADGVVGANGEVFDNPGLYVADASALPMSPGGAPSLTIAAWSANVADRLIAKLENRGSPSEDQRTVLKAT
ncbi:GMC oxidoreductase [Burkholderia sp. MR1-5-21]